MNNKTIVFEDEIPAAEKIPTMVNLKHPNELAEGFKLIPYVESDNHKAIRSLQTNRTTVGNNFLIKDDGIYLLITILRCSDIIESINYDIVDNNGIIVKGNCKSEIIGGTYYVGNDNYPLIASQYNEAYAVIKLPKDSDINNKIIYKMSYIYLNSTLRHKLAQSNIIFRKKSIRMEGGCVKGYKYNKFFKDVKGTVTYGTKLLNKNRGIFRMPRFFRQISNIKLTLKGETQISNVKLIIGGMNILTIENGHYAGTIPIHALMYHEIELCMELTEKLSSDKQDYVEISFDYDNSDNLPAICSCTEYYPGFYIKDGCIGPISKCDKIKE